MEENLPVQENKMGTMPVNKLLISMAVPIIISMIAQALYNVVDSVFVSRLGEDALTAVSLAFPVQNLMIAVATGTCVGVNALLAKSLGEKKQKLVDRVANNGIFLALCSAAAFALFGIFGAKYYFTVQTDIQTIVTYGKDYLFYCCTFSFGLFGQVLFERLLQATGRTIYSMISQLVGAVINIIFDPIFIFGLFGMPRMEVAGAAIATILGQIVAMIVGLLFNLRLNKDIHLSFRGILPKWSVIKRVYIIGLPSILMVSISSVMTFLLNKILLVFTSTAAAVFGVYFKLQSFIFMPVFGLNNGMVPIIAYNYGARRKDRILQTVRLSILYAVLIMMIGLAIFQLIPDRLLLLFNASENMLEIGVAALQRISWSFLFAGFCIVSGSVFQALGKSMYSLIVSIARQLVVLVPAAYLLSLTGVLNMVWLSFPIAEVASLILSAVFLQRVLSKLDI